MWWTYMAPFQGAYVTSTNIYNYNLYQYYQLRPNVPMAPPPSAAFYDHEYKAGLRAYQRNCYQGAKAKVKRDRADSVGSNSSVGDYLTWEMAQYESSLTKLSQSSEDLSNGASRVSCPHQQTSAENGAKQQKQGRQFDGASVQTSAAVAVNSTPAYSPVCVGGQRTPPDKIRTGTNGNATPSSCASSSAGSTPHSQQKLSMKAPGAIQRRHSAFQAGVKSPPDSLPNEQIDQVLERLDNGVELAFARAKAWSKYCKEILNFVHRRINLESDHARAVQKLAESTQAAIENEQFLPLHNVYLTSFKMEHEFFENCMDTMKRLYEFKFIKPLEARKAEQDRKRKELKAQWERCSKQVQEATAELKKSKQNFVTRENNYKKARETSVKLELSSPDKAKIDKRRKMEEDAMLRRQQAAEEVRSLERKVEEKAEELERMKLKILDDIRELIYQCDQTTKACTSAYFQSLAGLWSPLPAQYQSLSESCRAYIPGMEYAQYIKQIPFSPGSTRSHGRAASDDLLPSIAINGHVMLTENTPALHKSSLSVGAQLSSSFIDSGDEASINSYFETSVTSLTSTCSITSPSKGGKHGGKVPRCSSMSDVALTHRLQKVRMPTKCCHCDSYTFFQTVQCTECCMAWHKHCLSSLEVPCDVAKNLVSDAIQRRMSTRIFGAPLPPDGTVPTVLRNCVAELERRGCTIKGLYRVCGVKSKIEELCEHFERDTVDLSEVHPTSIASVAKLYLRQLPEPILTLKLYPHFIALAKENSSDNLCSEVGSSTESLIGQLKNLVQQLPKPNYDTLKFMVLHLHRLTWFEAENQMTAGNLGIVFGPTLLRRDDNNSSQASLNSLLEAPLQTRAIELLIEHAYSVFEADPAEDIERLGITRRKTSEGTATDINRRRLTRPSVLATDTLLSPDGDGHSNASSPRFTLDDDEVVTPRRNSTTPDLLKGSRNAHERSLSLIASSSSEFTPDSPDDSPERKASTGSEWRGLLASSVSREQRLHEAVTSVRRDSKAATVGRYRRATSPAQLEPSVITISDDSAPVITSGVAKRERPVTPVPVASPESDGGSPFQRSKAIVVRRVPSNRKNLLASRSTSSNSQGDDAVFEASGNDNDGNSINCNGGTIQQATQRPQRAASNLKRGSAPLLEKRQYRLSVDANSNDSQAKRKSQSVTVSGSVSTKGDKKTLDDHPVEKSDLAYV